MFIVTPDNNLLAKNPRVAAEWHPLKNNGQKPEDFRSGSQTKVWWICSKGHEWQAIINHRNNGRNCPKCFRIFCQEHTSQTEKALRMQLLEAMGHPEPTRDMQTPSYTPTTPDLLARINAKYGVRFNVTHPDILLDPNEIPGLSTRVFVEYDSQLHGGSVHWQRDRAKSELLRDSGLNVVVRIREPVLPELDLPDIHVVSCACGRPDGQESAVARVS